MARTTFRWLLRLFQKDFRDQFGDEIVEHMVLEALEMRRSSRMTYGKWLMTVTWELASAAFAHRVRMLSPTRVITWVAAGTSAIIVAAITVAAVFVAFEQAVRLPLLEVAKTKGAASPTLNLGGLIIVILFLLALHVRLSQRPGKWRDPAD